MPTPPARVWRSLLLRRCSRWVPRQSRSSAEASPPRRTIPIARTARRSSGRANAPRYARGYRSSPANNGPRLPAKCAATIPAARRRRQAKKPMQEKGKAMRASSDLRQSLRGLEVTSGAVRHPAFAVALNAFGATRSRIAMHDRVATAWLANTPPSFATDPGCCVRQPQRPRAASPTGISRPEVTDRDRETHCLSYPSFHRTYSHARIVNVHTRQGIGLPHWGYTLCGCCPPHDRMRNSSAFRGVSCDGATLRGFVRSGRARRSTMRWCIPLRPHSRPDALPVR